MARPWVKWYFDDWRSDPRLRMCSLSARGLWADILSYMHEGEPYGHFTIDGRVPELPDIARLTGASVKDVRLAYAELERHGVFSRDEKGIPFSRRLVRDREISDLGRQWIEKRHNPTRTPNRVPTALAAGDPITKKPEARYQIEPSSGSIPETNTLAPWPEDCEVPEAWIKAGHHARVMAALPPIDLAAEAVRFRAHFSSKLEKRTNWHQAWVKWCVNAYAKDSSNGPRFNGRNRAAETLRAIASEIGTEAEVHD